MNIFKWITGRAGKVALSAMQAVGLTAVVGVAGIAAWQYLDSPAETNNTFTPAAYDSGEVVYVAGANTGAYAGGSYAGGGESPSHPCKFPPIRSNVWNGRKCPSVRRKKWPNTRRIIPLL